jgi:hypothetical protein
MSEINFPDPQTYDADSFGSPLPPVQEKRGGRNRALWLTCGGCAVLVALACVCCAIGSYIGLRQDVGQAILWAGAFQQSNYDVAELLVCDNSQAAEITDQLADADAILIDYTFTQGTGENTRVDGTMEIEGVAEFWSATFIIADGGTFGGGLFGRCIDEINVIE